jgi:hypothetical protein
MSLKEKIHLALGQWKVTEVKNSHNSHNREYLHQPFLECSRIFLKILKDLQRQCELHRGQCKNKGRGIVVSPRPSPIVNHVLKGIVIMCYRLVSQVFISWRLMCC